MLIVELLLGIFLFGIVNCANTGKGASLYKDGDNVEYLHVSNYKKIYNSDRAAFVEFYSHWCGACQRYSKHWKALAAATKKWHSSVIRVAAINCADPDNSDVCSDYGINAYPTLKLVPAYAKFENKDHDATFVKTQENEILIKTMIDFLQNHSSKPNSWPNLSAYKSNSLSETFTNTPSSKMALIVFEEKNSRLGINVTIKSYFIVFIIITKQIFKSKLILDYAAHKHLLPIYRSNPEDNKHLINELKVTKMPSVYLIKNGNPKISFHNFDISTVNELLEAKNQLKESQLIGIEPKEMYSNLVEGLIVHLQPNVENVLKPIDTVSNSTKLPVALNNQIDRQSYLTK